MGIKGLLKSRTTPIGKVLGVVDYLAQQEKALSGDMVLVATPATLGSSAAAVNAAIGGAGAKFSRDIVIKLQDAAGNVHSWFNGTFAIAAAKVSTSGVVAIAGGLSVATFVNGVATITLNYTGTWAAADTQTFTVTGSTKLGYTIADKTSKDTLAA